MTEHPHSGPGDFTSEDWGSPYGPDPDFPSDEVPEGEDGLDETPEDQLDEGTNGP